MKTDNIRIKPFKADTAQYYFACVDRLHNQCVDRDINRLGIDLHRTQHAMLMLITKNNGIASQKMIADEFGISAAAVATTLKQLEKSGYIERRQDSEDTRRNVVGVSEKGAKVVEQSKKIFESTGKAMLNGISEEELEAFSSCLRKMMNNLKTHIEETEKENKE